jgi:hypothetical protein
MLDQNKTLVRHPEVVGEIVDGEAVLLLPHTGTVVVLNEVGRTIWELLDGVRPLNEIVTHIVAAYEVSAAQAQTDTFSFLDNLLARGLVLTA